MAVTYERMMEIAVITLYVYAAAGFVFALLFASYGISRVDEQVRGSSIWVRLIIIPGTVALWPWLLLRWWRSWAPGEENP